MNLPPAVPATASGPAPARTDALSGRALVLGGGGSTGNAWLIGIVAGLFDAGVDVTGADLTIGTSAGSTASFQFAGTTPPELFDAALQPVPASAAVPGRRPGAVSEHLTRMLGLIEASDGPADLRRRLGAAAVELDAASDGSWSPRWRSIVAPRLPVTAWPQRRILITAVDARTGEPVVFDRDGGVEPVDAVAASTSSGLPYRLGDALYLDGGFRRNENADLAAGCERVLVLSPFHGRSLTPAAWGMQLAAQVDELRTAGSLVEAVGPDDEHEHLFGTNAMDVTLRPAAAQVGFDQGRALAERLGEFWG